MAKAEVLYRRNTVLEALRGSRRKLYTLWLQKGLSHPQVEQITAAARQYRLPIHETHKDKLTQLAQDESHQGVVLEVGPYPYATVKEMLDLAAARQEKPFLLILDQVQGTQNIGIMLRTAEIVGVHGVILQERRAPDITPHIVTHSAGAAEHLLIGQVTNIVKTMQALQDHDVWSVGLDLDERARALGQIDLNMGVAIVVGHEGSGVRRLVRESCDFLLKLPMRGNVESLNAAAAASIVLYAAWQARGFEGFS